MLSNLRPRFFKLPSYTVPYLIVAIATLIRWVPCSTLPITCYWPHCSLLHFPSGFYFSLCSFQPESFATQCFFYPVGHFICLWNMHHYSTSFYELLLFPHLFKANILILMYDGMSLLAPHFSLILWLEPMTSKFILNGIGIEIKIEIETEIELDIETFTDIDIP